MNKFSDFGIKTGSGRTIYEVPKISISDIVNCEIEVQDFQANVKTEHGDDRYIVKIKHDGRDYKFFTTAAQIKEALDKVPKENFPFTTTIRSQRFDSGNKKTYYFT